MIERTDIDVEVRGLRVRFGDNLVLDGVDVDIRKGKITSVLGASGCGKTTLLKSMLGMVRPDGGRIHLLGRDVISAEREDLSKFLVNVGVTFQHGALFGSQTVMENIAMPLREHTDLDEATIRCLVRMKLGLVGMEEAVHKMPSELSGGMQKRAAIARALVLDPPILFFDEPSAGLDPITARQLDDLILFLNKSLECTIVVVTHEMRSAIRISDYAVFLSEGQVRAAGTIEEFQNSTDPAVRDFLTCSDLGESEMCPSVEDTQP